MGQPGFWDDQQRAARISTEHSRLTKRARPLHAAARRVRRRPRAAGDGRRARRRDRRVDSPLCSASSSVSRRRRSSTASTTRATPSSRSSAARAAPTHRTGPRWCCACTSAGLPTEGSRRSCGREPGRRGGLGVRPRSACAAGTRTGTLKAERGVHRLVRLSPFDQAHRRHTCRTRAGDRQPVARRRSGHRDRRSRNPRRQVSRLRCGRPACQQDRLGRPHHALTDRHRRAVPERAVAALQPAKRPSASSSHGSPSCELERREEELAR